MVAITASARVRSAAVVAGAAYSPVMPWPTSAGVLGMQRTTRALLLAAAMAAARMPAITDSCSAPPT